ncbi:hypothetical protein Esti_003902 [Eimeria stiedai]
MFSDENILGLLPPKEKPVEALPLRKSIHDGLCPPSYSTFNLRGTSTPGVRNVGGNRTPPSKSNQAYFKSAAMMGPPPGTVKAAPKEYLMKQSKAKKIESLQQLRQSKPHALETSRCKDKIKADIPKKSRTPIFGLKSDMNFVKYNAIINILSRPPAVKPQENFLKRKGYGQVPKYLSKVKAQIQSEYDFITSLKTNAKNSPEESRPTILPGEERLRLLEALKARWEALNHDYQAMTFKSKTATLGEARRKEYLEDQLSMLEPLMEKLQCDQVWVTAK